MSDNKIDDLINIIPLNNDTVDVAKEIVKEQDENKLRQLTNLFNLNQAKKNALRVLKLNSLLDKVSDEMIDRFEKHPGQFSNDELLSYLQVTQNAIDRANKSLNLVDQIPAIQLNQVNVNVNQDNVLDKESRERVKDAVEAIMKKIGKISQDSTVLNNDEDKNNEEPVITTIEDKSLLNEENN